MKIYAAFEQLFGDVSILLCRAHFLRFYKDWWFCLIWSGSNVCFWLLHFSGLYSVLRTVTACALQLPEQENVRQLPALLPSSLFYRFRKADEHQGNTERKHKHFCSHHSPVFTWLIGTGRKDTTISPKVKNRISKLFPQLKFTPAPVSDWWWKLWTNEYSA